jgi:hypothetical protein
MNITQLLALVSLLFAQSLFAQGPQGPQVGNPQGNYAYYGQRYGKTYHSLTLRLLWPTQTLWWLRISSKV